ncbi:urea amidolyase associated protein UAAP1 [Glycomyces salinus]|uniref:urea amidolyase associated protein UAAP1 n=1 Tax=Glycomyces salinus TaxID=980294 RepID=UPI0018EB53F2|nr:urea amidolyase associated protein UAAP1 [Glycomyces salinus]
MTGSASAQADTPEDSATATTYAARDHARAQESAATVADRSWVPADTFPDTTDHPEGQRLVWAETVAGGGYAHKVLAPGAVVELTDLEGESCAQLALFWAGRPWERLCVADTVKVQWNAYLGAGALLLSDQGRALASLDLDESGRHDTFCGAATAEQNRERFGDGEPWSATPAARELLKLAAAKNDLAPRDLPPTVSLFKGVKADPDGRLRWTGGAGAGARVRIRAEAPLLVMLANTPHPLDPREDYTVSSLRVLAWKDRPTAPDDPLWESTPEIRRALSNTAEFLGAAA